jgi:hypothetical protein
MLKKTMKREPGTRTVQAVVPMEMMDRLLEATRKRKMTVSAFVTASIELMLDVVEGK